MRESHKYLENIPSRGKSQCKVPKLEKHWHVGEAARKTEVCSVVVFKKKKKIVFPNLKECSF